MFLYERKGSQVTQVLSSPVMFSTDLAVMPEMAVTSRDLGDTRDLVLVSLLLGLWVSVILLFLHRWGEQKRQKAGGDMFQRIIKSRDRISDFACFVVCSFVYLQARSAACCPTSLSTVGRWLTR